MASWVCLFPRVPGLSFSPDIRVNGERLRFMSSRCDTFNDKIPDVRDGLTREERVVLYVLHETQKERGDRNVPTAMLWGRVCEHFYITPEELSEMLARLGARK